MKPSDFQKTVMCRFDSCLKKTVFGVVKDYYKELKKNQAEAIPFCELPDIIIDKVAIWDTYKTDYTTFNICGHDIYVYDDELAKVIKQLSDRYRENVLMYYFLDMSDEEILAKGVNDSLIHVDFMVGSDDLHIVGIHEDGSETDVFVNGTWAE